LRHRIGIRKGGHAAVVSSTIHAPVRALSKLTNTSQVLETTNRVFDCHECTTRVELEGFQGIEHPFHVFTVSHSLRRDWHRAIVMAVLTMMGTRSCRTGRGVMYVRDTGRIYPPLFLGYLAKPRGSEEMHIKLDIVKTVAKRFWNHAPNAMFGQHIDCETLSSRVTPKMINQRRARTSTDVDIKVSALHSRGCKELSLRQWTL
jgi:hypothetical protein